MSTTILLVDDDAQILETAKDILEANDYTVLTAESGAAALQCLRNHRCGVLIVDFNLLDTTGVDIAIHAKQIQPDVAVILMTGEANVDLGPAQAFVHSVLTKPVNPAELIQLIRQIS